MGGKSCDGSGKSLRKQLGPGSAENTWQHIDGPHWPYRTTYLADSSLAHVKPYPPAPNLTSELPKKRKQPEKDQRFETHCPSSAAAVVRSAVIRWWGWRGCFLVVVSDVN